MNLDVAKRLISNYVAGHGDFVTRANVAERYYRVKNDILFYKEHCPDELKNPLRSADNRVPFSFYNLLVNQKASYLFTYPPIFDTKDSDLNTLIVDTLGDDYAKKCKDLCVNASNSGMAWLHYWDDDEKGFCYAVVPSTQVIPVWSKKLNKKLLAVLRYYTDIDDDGISWTIYEYWTDTQCQAFRRRNGEEYSIRNDLMDYPMFFYDIPTANDNGYSNIYTHNMGVVPFIPFANNNLQTLDLDNIKKLIDSYDKTYSGFVNDLEDIQQVLFVLTNYGGMREEGVKGIVEFLRNLKRYKTINLDSAGTGDQSGLSTITIEIPVEARKELLEITRKAIFSMGQGIDPQQQSFDSTSGEAMKFLYSLLELKAGLMETEFRLGFGELVRAICHYHGKDIKNIIQTWTRNAIRSESELVDICSKSKGIISNRTIIKNHPLVDDPEQEEKQIAKEQAQQDIYNDDDEKGGEENV